MIQDMQLHGHSEATQKAYLRTVRQLSEFYQLSPDQITEDQLRDDFLHRKNVNQWSRTTMKIAYCGIIRRFLQHVLPTGLMKVRHYGFLNANSATPLERIRDLICALYEIIRDLIEPVPKPLVCPTCNQPLRWLCFIPPGVPSG